MNLNPYRAGNRPASPNVSAGALNQLMGMQQQTGEGLVNLIANAGKIDRTQKVNDLIARGGLDDLNEAQLQEKLLGVAGGSLTKQGQLGIDNLLGSRRAMDESGRLDLRQTGRQTARTAENIRKENVQEAEQIRKEGVNSGLTQGSYKGANGNMFHITKGGKHVDSGVKFKEDVKATGKGKYIDPMTRLGLSKPALTQFKNMPPALQKTMLKDDGTMKENIGWNVVPEKRNGSKITKKASGYFYDLITGQRLATGVKEEKKPTQTTMDKIFSIFD